VSAPKRVTLEDVLAVWRDYLRDNHPRKNCAWIAAGFADGTELRLPWPEGVESSPACSHSPDFRAVCWHGKHYRFTATRAAVVKVLWEAWETGTPEVGGALLLEAAGSESGRLRDLFRGCDAWDDGVIGPAGKGTFRLYAPDEMG
jgi:hypothetical protein